MFSILGKKAALLRMNSYSQRVSFARTRRLWTSRFIERVPIAVISNLEEGEQLLSKDEILNESLVGFGVNFRPGYMSEAGPGRVSVLQISTPKRTYIFQLFKFVKMSLHSARNNEDNKMKNNEKIYKFTRRIKYLNPVESNLMLELPPSLIDLLRRKDIFKVGYKIAELRNKLQDDWNVPLNGSLDLVNVVGQDYNYSLSQLCEYILNVDWDHHSTGVNFTHSNSAQEIHFSDWQADELTQEQILYAANEAFASLKVYEALQKNFKTVGILDKYFREIEKNLILKRLLEIGHATVDEIRSEISGYPITIRDQSDFDVLDEIYDPGLQETYHKWKIQGIQERKKLTQERKQIKIQKQNFTANTNPIFYENIELRDTEGRLLRIIDHESIAQNLINQGIAVKTSERSLQSKTETRSENCYDRATKHNICVCCGYSKKEVLTRTSILPKSLQTRCSHDEPLLCVECQDRWVIAQKEKENMIDYNCSAKVVKATRKMQKQLSLLAVCTCPRCNLTRLPNDDELMHLLFWRVSFVQAMLPRYLPFGWNVLYAK